MERAVRLASVIIPCFPPAFSPTNNTSSRKKKKEEKEGKEEETNQLIKRGAQVKLI